MVEKRGVSLLTCFTSLGVRRPLHTILELPQVWQVQILCLNIHMNSLRPRRVWEHISQSKLLIVQNYLAGIGPLNVPFVRSSLPRITLCSTLTQSFPALRQTRCRRSSSRESHLKKIPATTGTEKTPPGGSLFSKPAAKFPRNRQLSCSKTAPVSKSKLPARLQPTAIICCRLEAVQLLVKGHLIHNLVKSSHSLLGRSFTFPSNLARAAQPWHLGSITLIRNTSCRS